MKTPAQMREEAEDKLRPLGIERIRLLEQLHQVDDKLRPLVAAAVLVEVPLRRISVLTAIAPNTARNWAKEASA